MVNADERALKILEAIAREPRGEAGPVTLRDDYLADIARVESLPENQSGTDKSWVYRAIQQSQRVHAAAIVKR